MIINHRLSEKFYDLCVCSSRACRLHFGSHPNRRLRILIKILTLRLCSYINLFSCQISSYGLLLSLRRLSGYGLSWLPGISLATFIQRKMELNDCCSPDLLNVRRQPLRLASNIKQSFYSRATQHSCCTVAISSRRWRSPSLTL